LDFLRDLEADYTERKVIFQIIFIFVFPMFQSIFLGILLLPYVYASTILKEKSFRIYDLVGNLLQSISIGRAYWKMFVSFGNHHSYKKGLYISLTQSFVSLSILERFCFIQFKSIIPLALPRATLKFI